MQDLRSTTVQAAAIVIFFAIALMQACVHEPLVVQDNQSTDPPPVTEEENCNPETVYFQNEVLPILISNCAKSGCHDAATAEEDVILDSYAHIMNSDEEVITPFDLDDSELYERISENDSDKVMPPPPHEKLSSDQISTIRRWILQGAQNNACASVACDTTEVTFSGAIFPLLTNKCVGCHSGNTPSGSLNFSTHQGVQAVAQDGRLIGAVTHVTGFAPMPQGGSKLSECEIGQINKWIVEGALNN